MSDYKIIIIGCYFGKFPKYIDLWLNSCAYNPDINWIIYTDQKMNNLPSNVEAKNLTFMQLGELASKKLNDDSISLQYPYKICDFRPAFGIIFEDDIKGFDFWGHCDFDMIFGDIRKYFTDELLKDHDKLLKNGHLTLYRNDTKTNSLFLLQGSSYDSKTVFNINKNFTYDEVGINEICKKNGVSLYFERIFADIAMIYHRFRIIGLINYDNQVFFWENGKVFRGYISENGTINYEEFIYIHFKKRNFDGYPFDLEKGTSFFITPSGFHVKQCGVLNLSDFKKFNPYHGKIYEYIEDIFEFKNRLIKKFFRK